MRRPFIRLTYARAIDKLCDSVKAPSLNMLREYFKNPLLRVIAVIVTGGITLSAVGSQRGAGPTPASSAAAKSPHRALIDQYCTNCHNSDDRVAGLALDTLSLDRIPEAAETWEKVVKKLRGGMMPPIGQPKPEAVAVDSLISTLETSLDRAGTAKPNPGRSAIHRLNRTEYGNAVRDLFDIDVDVAELLPPDDESDGFDNIAEVLRLSPSLVEQYLAASRKISSLALGDPAILPVTQTFRIPPDRSQSDHVEGLPLGTRGGILIHRDFPLDAEYDLNVVLLRNVLGYMRGLEWPHQLEVSVDGERMFMVPVGGVDDNRLSDANFATAAESIDLRTRTRLPLRAGPHTIGVAFIRKNSSESDEPLQLHTRDHDLQNMNGIPAVDHVDITGPFHGTGPGETPSRKKILMCRPVSNAAAEETACAKRILSALARRTYRQPVMDNDVAPLMEFYQSGRKKGSFDAGIQSALQVILTSPKFLFRTEIDPANVASGTIYKLGDMDLASRLSFFLWSSIPDEELLGLAEKGRLKDPAVLDAQVQRMLADPRASALVSNFAGQWLFLRNLQSARPDGPTFPNFDDNLRQAMRRETELLFESIMRENRSVVDLLGANYTFVNERLAKHYGIPNVYGSQFRRVTLTDPARFGLLGQGSILTVTSYPNRTSPVLRGKWILENIMGTPPPPPPPGVPPLKENEEGAKPRSVRELMELHRANPACASCHAVMDPLGFSLENFDATGEWRKKDFSGPIDPAGQLADGTKVNGPVSLREAILKHSDQFVNTMTEKMLTYSLGRGLEYYDIPVVRGIVKDSAKNNYRFATIVMDIVKSTPFQMKVKS